MDYLSLMIGAICGGGLTAVLIFATDIWYARRHPIMERRS